MSSRDIDPVMTAAAAARAASLGVEGDGPGFSSREASSAGGQVCPCGAGEAGDAFVDPPGPGGDQGHGRSCVGDVGGEVVEPLVRVAVWFVVAVDGDGVHRCHEGGSRRRLGYRETLVEEQQSQVRRALAAAACDGRGRERGRSSRAPGWRCCPCRGPGLRRGCCPAAGGGSSRLPGSSRSRRARAGARGRAAADRPRSECRWTCQGRYRRRSRPWPGCHPIRWLPSERQPHGNPMA